MKKDYLRLDHLMNKLSKMGLNGDVNHDDVIIGSEMHSVGFFRSRVMQRVSGGIDNVKLSGSQFGLDLALNHDRFQN